jgi:hypothetical protein
MTSKSLRGYRIKNGKIEKMKGHGLDASAKIRQRKSKKITVKRKLPT